MKTRQTARLGYRCVESLETRRLFAGGTPDYTFSDDGTATVDSFGVTLNSVASKVDNQGRVVTVGGTSDGKWAIARFKIDGTLDTTFGSNLDGKVTVKINDGQDSATDLAFQKDGKIVVVGYTSHGDKFGVVRLNTNGTLDKTFDSDGKRSFDFGFYSISGFARAVAIQPDGKIVIAGDAYIGGFDQSDANDDFAIARLNTNGSMDTSFDYDGMRYVGLGDFEECTGIGFDTSGRIIVTGYSANTSNAGPKTSAIAAVRFNSSGALDARFDTDGEARYYLNGKPIITTGMVMQGDKVVITGTFNNTDLVMARLGVDGKLDTTFGNNGTGWKTVDLGGTEKAFGATRTANGGFLVSASVSGKTTLLKYTANGAADTAFGNGGVAYPVGPLGFGKISAFGERFVMAGGGKFRTSRFVDATSNVVSVGTFAPSAREGETGTRAFVVTRSLRLPYPTNVYLDLGGTATAPLYNLPRRNTGEDYGIMQAAVPGVTGLSHYYATIPANETFTTVVLTIRDDAVAEPTETIVPTIVPDAAYDIGLPSTQFTIADNDSPGSTKTLRATADAFVKDGGSAGTNFGNSTELQSKNNTGPAGGDARQSFLKFDLASISSVGSAKLRIYGKLNNTAQTNVKTELHSSGITSWSETGITWNNRPAFRDQVIGQATIVDATSRWYEIDVSDYLRAEKIAGRNTVTLVLVNPTASDPYAAFSSDEAASNRPELMITA